MIVKKSWFKVHVNGKIVYISVLLFQEKRNYLLIAIGSVIIIMV